MTNILLVCVCVCGFAIYSLYDAIRQQRTVLLAHQVGHNPARTANLVQGAAVGAEDTDRRTSLFGVGQVYEQ